MQKPKINTYFDVEVAKALDVNSAIILSNIEFWIHRNELNSKNFHDGRFWTYNSVQAFGDLFPWLSTKQIRRCLEKLITEGYLIDGNFSQDPRDRTRWYAYGQNREMHLPKRASSFAQTDKSYKEQIINTDNKRTSRAPSGVSDIETSVPKSAFEYFKTNYCSMYDAAFMKFPAHVKSDLEQFAMIFDSKVLAEGIEYDGKKLYGRMMGLARNWKRDDSAAAPTRKRKLLT